MGHPVRLVVADDLRRSRLTVLLRPLLGVPPTLWALLWSVVTCATVAFAWLAAVAAGRVPARLYELHVRHVRRLTHVVAYLLLVANPYPPFSGHPGYPIDVALEPAPRQPRLLTLLRPVLGLPAVVFASVLAALLVACGVLAFLPCLFLGRCARGLRDLEAYCIHFCMQTVAYLMLVTARYPTLTYGPASAPLTQS